MNTKYNTGVLKVNSIENYAIVHRKVAKSSKGYLFSVMKNSNITQLSIQVLYLSKR